MVVALPRNNEATLQSVVFGKLPNRPDFIRINAAHPVAQELDGLVQNALEQFRTQEGWEKRYDASPMVDVFYASRDKRWLFLGTLRASRDQSGRRYPLIAGVAFPANNLAGERRLLPIACELFYEGLRTQLANAVAHSLEGADCRQFLESHARLWNTGSSEEMLLAAKIVGHFLDSQHPSVLEGPLIESTPSGTLAQALLNISFFRGFLRRFNSFENTQMIALPVHGEKGLITLHACAWLSILSTIHGEDWSGGFLLSRGQDYGTAHLFVDLSHVSARTLLAALGGNTSCDERLNLCSEQKTWQTHRLYPESAYALERLLSNPCLAISNLITFIHEASKNITTSAFQ